MFLTIDDLYIEWRGRPVYDVWTEVPFTVRRKSDDSQLCGGRCQVLLAQGEFFSDEVEKQVLGQAVESYNDGVRQDLIANHFRAVRISEYFSRKGEVSSGDRN